MEFITSPPQAANWSAAQRLKGRTVAFVPTMGALHEGHITLVKAARERGKAVASSIFVNPLQFNNPSDLAHYPRQLEQDRRMLEEAGCDLLFAPDKEEIFARFTPRRYDLAPLDEVLEGPSRPGHFLGVVNVVERLFFYIRPDVALFGEKDRQQLAILKHAARKERWPVRVEGHATIRANDGLALSSRNQRLSPTERAVAPVLYRALLAAEAKAFKAPVSDAIAAGLSALASEPTVVIDYFAIAHPETLQPLSSWDGLDEAVALVTDSLGRKVFLPVRAERIISLQPETTRIIIALGSGDRLVGIDYFMLKQDLLFPVIFPRGRNLPAVSNTPEDMNFETVMKLEPDIIFVSPTERQMVDALQAKTGKPVVALASMGRFEKLAGEITLLGELLGREDRARGLILFLNGRLERIREKTASLSRDQKPRVYLSFWGSLTRTPIEYEPVDAAGGINCASGILPAHAGSINTVVQIEKLIEWRPDIILVQGNYKPSERAVAVEDILGDKRLGSIPAVMNKRVFYTFGFWYWWDPAEALVETIYLASLFHPDLFGPIDLEREGNAVFMEFYGVENAFTALCRVLGFGSRHGD